MVMLGLNDLIFDDGGPIDQEFAKRRRAIERACGFLAFGACEFDEGEGGALLFIPEQITSARHAVVLSPGIAAAPDANTLGSGQIMLRKRDGAALVDDVEATLYINFTTAIPTGTRVTVVPDGTDGKSWTIPGANCPPPEEP